MCLQAHYRSEMEFTWEGLLAAQTRLKRIVMGLTEFVDIFWSDVGNTAKASDLGDDQLRGLLARFDEAISDDLNTAVAISVFEQAIAAKETERGEHAVALALMDSCFGYLGSLTRTDLRIRPATATLTKADIEARLAERKAARAAKDFVTSDRIRDELAAAGVEVMDGDPLGWDWKPVLQPMH